MNSPRGSLRNVTFACLDNQEAQSFGFLWQILGCGDIWGLSTLRFWESAGYSTVSYLSTFFGGGGEWGE